MFSHLRTDGNKRARTVIEAHMKLEARNTTPPSSAHAHNRAYMMVICASVNTKVNSTLKGKLRSTLYDNDVIHHVVVKKKLKNMINSIHSKR